MELVGEKLGVRWGSHEVFEGLSFALPFPSRIHLTGGAGAGKTVLLKVLAGLILPTSGRLLWNGRSVAELSRVERKALQAHFGMVFQSDALFDSQTVLENVTLPLLRRGESRERALERAREVLASVGLAKSENTLPARLSGGMKKRVGIARAIVAGPEILLADEPFAGLDPGTLHQVTEVLARVSEGRSLIVTGEEALPALKLNRVLTLRDGLLEEARA